MKLWSISMYKINQFWHKQHRYCTYPTSLCWTLIPVPQCPCSIRQATDLHRPYASGLWSCPSSCCSPSSPQSFVTLISLSYMCRKRGLAIPTALRLGRSKITRWHWTDIYPAQTHLLTIDKFDLLCGCKDI